MLIGVRLIAIRWAVIGVLVGAAGMGCALASAAVTDPPPWELLRVLPQPAAGWLVASHPPRTVDSDVILTATRDGLRLTVEHEVTLQAGDQLINAIRSADVTSSGLALYLLGTSYRGLGVNPALKPKFMEPILEFKPEQQSTVIARFGFMVNGDASKHTERIGETGYVDYLMELEDSGKTPVPTALASTRTWSVHADGFRIIGVQGQPVRQDVNTVVFQGPPGKTVVAFQRGLDAPTQTLSSSVEEQYSTNDESSSILGPFDWFAFMAKQGWLAWALTLLLPWCVILFSEGSTTNPASAQARRVALVIVTSFSFVGVAAQYASERADAIGVAELMMVLPALIAATILHLGKRPWARRLVVVQSVTALVAVTIGLVFAVRSGSTVNYGALVAALVIGGCAVAGLVRLTLGRRYVLAGAGLGIAIVSAVIAGTQLDAIITYTIERPLISLLILAAVGLLAANATTAAVQLWQPRRPILWIAISLMAGILLFLPIVRLLHDPASGVMTAVSVIDDLNNTANLSAVLLTVLNVLFVIIALVVLRHYGRDVTALQEPLIWTLGVALMLCLSYDSKPFSWADSLSVVAFWIALWWLLPLKRRDEAVRHGAVKLRTHARLIRAETRRRIAQLGAHDLYRRARARLAAEEIDLNAYNRRQRILDDAASVNGKRVDEVPLEWALGTSAGCTPWQNALASVGFALPIGGLIITYEAWLFVANNEAMTWFPDTVAVLDAARHLARWLGYGLLFGYFYPLLFGRTPVVKALALSLAVLVAEIPPILAVSPSEVSPDVAIFSSLDLVTAVAIRTGQVVVFCFVLGLAWERRLGHLAGFTWDRLRNIRSIQALATPATTVVVAAATALATALAGAVVTGLLTTGSKQVPELNPSDSPSSVPATLSDSPR